MTRLFRSLAVLVAGALSLAAGPAANWNATITLGPDGSHLLGNPKAAIRLTEYASYTCPHCAEFARQAEPPLRIAYVRSGKVAWEIKHLIRDPIDLTAAMLVNCGPKEKFFLNNAAFFGSQATWIKPLVSSTAAQQARWQNPDLGTRNRAIASDFHFYAIMATRGYDRVAVDRCLADAAVAKRIAAQSKAGAEIGVNGTPMFAINGDLLADTYDWSVLRPQLDARM